jgi:hypothetical protein
MLGLDRDAMLIGECGDCSLKGSKKPGDGSV